MKDAPSVEFELPPLGVNPLADAIREAVGATPTAPIVVVTPQFTRPHGAPVPGQPPSTLEDWQGYRTLTMPDLVALGWGNWDGGLALIPGDWYAALPAGLVLDCIDGSRATVGVDQIDDDIRYGCLAYGFRLGPATDGEGP